MSKKKIVAVIGIGAFGLDLVKKLKELNSEVVAIDKDPSRVVLTGDIADRSFICDANDTSTLEECGIDKVDVAIVAMGQNDSRAVISTITTTIALRKLGVKEIIVRIDDESYKEILTEIGATTLFSPLKMASERLANVVVAENYEDYFNISDEYSVLEIEVSKTFKEITLINLNAPSKYGVNIVLIKRENKMFMPKGDDVIKANDKVFAFGTKENAGELAEYLTK